MKEKLLFKYKPINESADEKENQALKDLVHNRLWVSRYSALNDPSEFAFWVDKNRLSKEELTDLNRNLNLFSSLLQRTCFALSLSTSLKNRRLWNYYTNGTRGFVLGYEKQDIDKSINELGLSYHAEPVSYSSNRIDLTHRYKQAFNNIESEGLEDYRLVFRKGPSWKYEKEFRYSIGNGSKNVDDIIEEQTMSNEIKEGNLNGFYLHSIQPKLVVIGFKTPENIFMKVKEYCTNNNVPCKIYFLDYTSKKEKFLIS